MNKEEQAAAEEAKREIILERKRINDKKRRERLKVEAAEAKKAAEEKDNAAKEAKKIADSQYYFCVRKPKLQKLQQKNQQSNMSSSPPSSPPSSTPSPKGLPVGTLVNLLTPGTKAVPAEHISLVKAQLEGQYSVQKAKYAFEKQESERHLEKEKQKTRGLDIQLEKEKGKNTETVTNTLNKSMDVGGADGLKDTSNAIIAASTGKKKSKSRLNALEDAADDTLERLGLEGKSNAVKSNDDGEYEIRLPPPSRAGTFVGGDDISVLSSLSGNQTRDEAEGETPPTDMATTASDSTKTTEFHSCVASAVPSPKNPKAGNFSTSTKPMTSATKDKVKPDVASAVSFSKKPKAVNFSPSTKPPTKAWTVEEDEESADTNNLRAVTGRSPVKKPPATAKPFEVGDVVTVVGVINCEFKIVEILDDGDGTKYKLTYKYPKSKNGMPYPHEAEEAELFFVAVVQVGDDDDENVDPNMDVKTGTTHENNVDIVNPSKSTTPSKKAPADISEPKEGDSLESFFDPSTGLTFSVGDTVICFVGNTKCVASITGMLAEKLAGELTAKCDLEIISPKSKAGTTSADVDTLSKYGGEDDTADDDENVDPNVVEVKTTTPAKTATAKKPVKSTKTPAKKPVKTTTPAKTATAKKTTMTPAKKVSPIKTTAKSTKSTTTTKKKTPCKKTTSTSTTTSTTTSSTTSSTTTTRTTRPRRTCTMK